MHDFFPLSNPPIFRVVGSKIAEYTNLDALPLHFHEVVLSALFYHAICTYISPPLSRSVFPKTYSKLNEKTRLNWDIHVTSFVQSTTISALGLYVLMYDEERAAMDYRERVWGYTGATGMVQALGCGYFLWDFWISLVNVNLFGAGLLGHAASALWVYGMGFRPFTAPYACVFILYELSSPFLNIHWALDKLNMTGSNTQLVNGIFLMTSFFGSRLVFGVYQSFCVFTDIFRAISYQQSVEGKAWLRATALSHPSSTASVLDGKRLDQVMRYANNKEVPYWYAITYLTANVVLTLLNVYWFGQMITTIRKRFDPPFGTKEQTSKTEPVMGRGIDSDGTKSVEVSSTDVRRRGKKGKTGNEDSMNQPAT